MRRPLGSLFRLTLFAACVLYAFWGVDFRSLTASLAAYTAPAIVAAVSLSLLAYLALGLRLNGMMRERPGVATCTLASVLALGVNNMLPAKLGEVAKVVYLRQRVQVPVPRLVALVFWERFADLNAVLLIAVVTLALLQVRVGLMLPLAVVFGVWLLLWVVTRWPHRLERLVGLLPLPRVGKLVVELAAHVSSGLRGGRHVFALVIGSVLVWCLYASSAATILLFAAGLSITPAAAVAVFAVASLGMAVPATPGGLGLYEAAMVAALAWFGVDRSEALAAALVTHMVQFIPTTVAGALLLAHSRLQLSALRSGAQGG